MLYGEPGVGKTALLQYVMERASGFRVARASGVQSEMEIAFAGLHQLCAPLLARLDMLPDPQRDALRTTFGLSAGAPPDRFLVGLAVLGLLSSAAEERPLICLVDDAQWLDHASEQALMFVARRLLAEPVSLILARRDLGEPTGLPKLAVGGLRPVDARALLASAVGGPLDTRVRDRIVAETRGNPLALLELPRGMTPAELAGGFGLPDARGVPGRIEASFGGACKPYLPTRSGSCCSLRRSRSATRSWCGAPPSSSRSRSRRLVPPPRRTCSSSAIACASRTRLCVRPSTARPRPQSDESSSRAGRGHGPRA